MLVFVNYFGASYSQQQTEQPRGTSVTNPPVISGEKKEIYQATSDSPTFIDGMYGNAIKFRAYYEDFFMASKGAAQLANPTFTISFWMKRDPDAANYGHVISYVNNTAKSGWLFDISNTTEQSIRFGVMNNTGQTFYTKDIALPVDKFVNIIGTFDGSELRIYRNGTLYGATKFSGNYIADPHVPLKVGMAAYCTSCLPGAGAIDDLRIYNRVLNESEIVATARGLGETFNPNSSYFHGLVGYWKFDSNLSDAIGENHGIISTIVAGMTFAPDGRLFFTEKNTGKIRIIQNDLVLSEPFAILNDTKPGIMYGLLGITLDPEFEQNHFVYAYYTARANNTIGQEIVYNRIVRFTDVNSTGTNMTVIFDRIPASNGMHTGGALAFGPDGKLYASVGEGYNPPAAQNKTSLLGKILRINKDGTIPSDNPFPGSPIFSIGHRNVYGMAFNNETGVGILTENGAEIYDEINLIRKGGNYGWPTLQPPDADPQLANNSSLKPIRTYKLPVAPAQLIFYDKDKAKFPELQNMFVFGSFNRGELYALQLDSSGEHVIRELEIQLRNPFIDPVVSVTASPDGEIYFGGHGIYKLTSLS
jgi:glucose/arabinose dehydrogenase